MNLVIKEAAVLNVRNIVIVATPKVGAMATLGSSCIIADSPHPVRLLKAIELAMKLPENRRQQMLSEINLLVKLNNLNSWAFEILQPIIELAESKSASFVRL
jgi:trehalose-6-phosphate synthase